MDTRQQRRQTARAARELLQDRVPAVEELATKNAAIEEAQAAVTAARAHLDEAQREYAQQYAAATKVGWSAEELRRLGCQAPRTGTRGRGRGGDQTRSTTPRSSPTDGQTTAPAPGPQVGAGEPAASADGAHAAGRP